MDISLDPFKKFWARLSGSVYESPEPLRGIVEQSTRYSGEKPSRFSIAKKAGDSNPRFSIATGPASDVVEDMSGANVSLVTTDGDDTVRTATGKHPLSSSSINLGAGNDVFVPGFTWDGHLQTNHVYGNLGRDTILLQPGNDYELTGEIWRPASPDGSHANKVDLLGKDGEEWGQHYICEDFEFLRFESGDAQGNVRAYTFPLDDVLTLEHGYNDTKHVRFNPENGQLEITYQPPGTSDGQKTTVSLASLEERATRHEAEEISPPHATPLPRSAEEEPRKR